MRKIHLLAILVILSQAVLGQGYPSGLPWGKSTGYYIWGYTQSDSGRIDARRDTNWLPSKIPTTVYWEHLGVDSAFWTYKKTTGKRWDKIGSGSSTSGSYVPLADSVTGYVTPTKLRNDSLVLSSGAYYGKIYQNVNFPTLTGFIQSGTSVTDSSGHLVFSGGGGNFNNSLNIDSNQNQLLSGYYSNLEHWRFAVKAKIINRGFIGIGLKATTINSPSFGAFAGLNTWSGKSFFIDSSASALSFSLGDVVEIIAERDYEKTNISVRNVTTNSATISKASQFNLVTANMPVTGQFALFNHSGKHYIDSISVSSNEQVGTDLLIIGDSKTQGVFNNYLTRYPSLLGNFYSYSVHAGYYETTADWITTLNEVLRLHPKNVMLTNPSNDLRTLVNTDSTKARYNRIENALRAAGINVYHANGFFELGGSNPTAWVAWIASTKSIDSTIDTYNPTTIEGTLIADGVHLTTLGNTVSANAIMASGKIRTSIPTAITPNKFIANQTDAEQSAGFNIGGIKSYVNSDVMVGHYLGVGGVSFTPANYVDVNSVVALGYNPAGYPAMTFGATATGTANPGAYIYAVPTGSYGDKVKIAARNAAGGGTLDVLQISGEGVGSVSINSTTEDSALHVGQGVNIERGLRVQGLVSGASTDSIVTVDNNGVLRKLNASSITPATPTLQDVISAGSTLTTTNTINGGGNDLSMGNFGNFFATSRTGSYLGTNGSFSSRATTVLADNYSTVLKTESPGGTNGSYLYVYKDSMMLQPQFGNLYIDSLNKAAGNVQIRYNTTTGAVSYLDTLHSLTLLTNRGIKITASTTGDTVYIDDFVKVATTTSASTITPNCDTTNMYTVTALATDPTFAAPSGTPYDGQPLTIRVKDNGTSRTLTWNSIYRASTDFALPTATTISKTFYIQFIYNAADTKWDATGLTSGF